jgi:hypothetical protein
VEHEGSREGQLEEPVHDPGDEARHDAPPHGDEDHGQKLKADGAALRHGEEPHLAEHGGERDSDADLCVRLDAPGPGVGVKARMT